MKSPLLHLLALAASLCVVACSKPAAEEESESSEDEAVARNRIDSVISGAATARYVLEKGIVTSLHAKEMCSCLFVAKMPEEECRDQVRMPVDVAVLVRLLGRAPTSDDLVDTEIDRANQRVVVRGKVSGPIASALRISSRVNPKSVATRDPDARYGCRITAKDGVTP